jgi:phenylalanyl-tRNA synthetase beta chain
MIAGVWSGSRDPLSWHARETPCDFYDIKGAVEGLLGALKLQAVEMTQAPEGQCVYTRPGHSGIILAGGRPIGLIGELHPAVCNAFDLKQTAFLFELAVGELETLLSETRYRMRSLKFPAVVRDITLIVDRSLEAQAVLTAVGAMGLDRLESVQLFDVFSGEPVPAGKRSLSFRLTYRSPEKTLEDPEVNALHQFVTQRLLTAFQATLPGG